jgi:hypothetical protein
LTGRKGKDDGRQRENARRKTTYEALDLAALGLVSDGGDGVDVLLGELDKSQVGLDAGRSDRLGNAVEEGKREDWSAWTGREKGGKENAHGVATDDTP